MLKCKLDTLGWYINQVTFYCSNLPKHIVDYLPETESLLFTVKLRYNRLTYNASSGYSVHFFSVPPLFHTKHSVSTYLDITYPRLLWTDFWAQTLQWTPLSTYVCPPSRRLHSWLQSIMCWQSVRHFDAVRMWSGVRIGVLIALLIAANVG